MRFVLLASVSALGLFGLVGPASAGSDMTGVAQLYVGMGTTDDNVDLDDPFIYGGKAKGYWPLSPDVHFQVDLFAEQGNDLFDGGEWNESDASTFGAAVHLIHPFENRARFGVAGSLWSNDVLDGSNDNTADATYGLVQIEGQFFGTDWSVIGQAGIFTSIECDAGAGGDECSGTFEKGTYVRGKVRYFLNDNTAFGLETTQMWGSLETTCGSCFYDAATSIWIFDAEHKFADSPFSGFIALSHESLNEGGDIDAQTNTVWLGAKFYLDQPTLRSNDKSGAEFETPTFGNSLETIFAPWD